MRRPSLTVWALEPYYAGSHRAFLDGLAERSCHDFTLFTLPGRNWKWRMHGAPLSLAGQVRCAEGSTNARPHVFFASDMLDLPVFLAHLRSARRRVATLLYMHENQLTYPVPQGLERDLSYGFKNLTSASVADVVVFNSDFHRAEFLQAASELMGAMPDEVPCGLVDDIAERSVTVPVGCDLHRFDAHEHQGRADGAGGRWGDPTCGPLLLWNQRWEYDKAPGDLFAALYELLERGVPFRLAMAGPNQGAPTAEFVKAREVLGERIVQWGRVDDPSDYASLLWAADVVASTALHEFFGVAVVEAVYCGCRPVLPRRLSYPEIIPVEAHDEVLYDEGGLAGALARALAEPDAWSEEWQRSWVSRFDWGCVGDLHDEEIRRCWNKAGRSEAWRV